MNRSVPKGARNKRADGAELRPEEWAMFKDCPEREINLCLAYEYARVSPEIVKRVTKFDEQLRREPFAGNLAGFCYCCGITHYLSHILWPFRDAFPKSAWLDIPETRRKSASFADSVAHDDPRDWEQQAYLGYSANCAADVDKLKVLKCPNNNLVEVYESHVDHLEGEAGAQIEQQRRRGYRSRAEQVEREAAPAKPVPVTYFVHRVNWDKSDPVLVEEFKAWLHHWREGRPVERRGQTSPRDHLKALAAKRWLKLTAWDKAADITQKTLGKPLYAEQPAWIRAKRDAEDYLAQFTRTHVKHPAGRNIF